ncbi:hypothetical protein D0Q02_01860 [Micromonospora craniellae]|uniref:Gcp-like domain-containing protein n=1 Tax=Micromonospora craniellae TaxID=2294034 RepID=A0A372G5F5_9ACTN|nr:hypothetical protein [Micromonospora craniellae]QOC90356.1 hypothetical protein ID554_19480 [Micromonospora craniellae]RFS48255.1 hypothetical protein D0Q02_01860 [Micromonospora craniellae]
MADEPLILGIETSCDESGVGIVRGHTLLADALASSVDQHARFGGVVPEVASRAHLEAIVPTMQRALTEAGVTLAGWPGWAARHGIRVRVPRPGLCTDNGAMVAALGSHLVPSGVAPSRLDLPADSAMPLTTVSA